MTDPQPQPSAAPAPATKEYVAGGSWAWSNTALRSLPWAFDDLSQDFGDDIYERMLLDPAIAASMNILKAGILEDGAQLHTAVPDKDGDGFEQAKELVTACEQALDDMALALDDTLWDMLDALALGNKVAEVTYCLETAPSGALRYTLAGIKPKPRRATAFVVDPYLNVTGLLGLIPGQGFNVQTGTILGDPEKQPNLLPRDKFAILSFRPKDADPRGSTILRPAYNPWWVKMQTWPEYLKYLAQFASPSLVGKTAEGAHASGATDAQNRPLTPEQELLTTLLSFRNATAIALAHGSELDALFSQGEGRAFLEAFGLCDRQIVTAILTQTRATMESQHGSRADSTTGQDVLATLVRQIKKAVQRMLRRDVLRQLVRLNYGDAALSLTPKVSLGTVEQEDMSGMMTAIAALERVNYLDPSQFPAVDALLGLPARSAEELARRADRAANPPAPVVVQPGGSPGQQQPGEDDTQNDDDAQGDAPKENKQP